MTTPIPLQPQIRRKIEIRSNDGRGILFCYIPESESIEVKEGDTVYLIPLWHITEFSRASQRNVFTVYPQDLPCGHEAGTVLDKNQCWVCAICGQ